MKILCFYRGRNRKDITLAAGDDAFQLTFKGFHCFFEKARGFVIVI